MKSLHIPSRGAFVFRLLIRCVCLPLATLLLCGQWTNTATAEKVVRVVVLRQSDNRSSARVLKGVRSSLRSKPNLHVELITTHELSETDPSILDTVRSLHPAVIVTIGSGLTALLSDSIKDIPVVFAGVLQPEASGFVASRKTPGGNVTGASLDIPPAVQFKYFLQVCPNVRKLGIIYSDNTASLIPHARIVAEQAGLSLVPIKVEQNKRGSYERQVNKALDSLLKTVDGLWSLADPAIFSNISTKLIISKTLRRRVPMMGFSSTIVESGALFALDFDYKDIGRQTGGLILRILGGEKPARLSVTRPGIIWFHYNENTAKRIAVDVPEQLRVIAKEVHR